jgi:hypothetical protein
MQSQSQRLSRNIITLGPDGVPVVIPIYHQIGPGRRSSIYRAKYNKWPPHQGMRERDRRQRQMSK